MKTLIKTILTALLMIADPVLADETAISITDDIPFGDLERQTLDVYWPETVNDKTPVLVFLFGGGFSMGSKGQVRAIGKSFAKSGMIVVAPNYRIYPSAVFPDFVEDCSKAVAHAWRTMQTNAGDPRPIILSGWSAGAYISALVAYDGRYLAAQGLPPSAIKGFVGLAGPYTGGLCAGQLCPHIFLDGTEADWPVDRFVDSTDPPMLLVQGALDTYVDIGNLETLSEAGDEAGIDVITLVVEKRFHKHVMWDLEESGTEVRDAVDAFLASVLTD